MRYTNLLSTVSHILCHEYSPYIFMHRIRGQVSFSQTLGCYSINNCVYFDYKPLFLCDFVVFGLIHFSNTIYCYGGTEFGMYSLKSSSKSHFLRKSFDSWILDVWVKDGVVISFMDGSVYYTDKEFSHIKVKSVYSSKIINKKEIMFGCHEKVCVVKGIGEEIEHTEGGEVSDLTNSIFMHSHKGCVYAVCFTPYGWMSAGEDRRVVISDSSGQWEIKEDNNYVIKCGMGKDYCYTINRDGTLKIYTNKEGVHTLTRVEHTNERVEHTNERLALSLETCFLGISDVLIKENDVFVGLANGKIIKLKINKDTLKMSKRIDLNKMNLRNNNDSTEVKSIGSHKVLNGLNLSGTILKTIETNKHIHLLFKKAVFVCSKKEGKAKESLDIHKVDYHKVDIFKPTCVRGGVIGTKRGFILVKGHKYKISNEEILDIFKTKRRLYFKTAKERIVIERAKINDKNTNLINIAFTRPLEKGSKIIKSQIPSNHIKRINKIQTNSFECYREITTACRVGDYILCGTSESKLVLFYKDVLVDCIKVDGQVSKIHTNGSMVVCGTKRGLVYFVKIIRKRLWVSCFKNNFKICDLMIRDNSFGLFVLDSGGYLSIYKSRERLRSIFLNEYCCSFLVINCLCYVGTSNGHLVEVDLQTGEKAIYKVEGLSILSIIESKRHLVMIGDSHCVIKFDLKTKEVVRKCVGSDPLVQILIHKDKIRILSRSGRFLTLNEDFEKVNDERIVCDATNCMVGGRELMFFGTGCLYYKDA